MDTFKMPQVENQTTLCCENCVHAIPEAMPGQLMRQLVCHRFPPQIVLVPAPPKNKSTISLPGEDDLPKVMLQSMFPPVSAQMFCHSHTLARENPNEAVAVAEPGAIG